MGNRGRDLRRRSAIMGTSASAAAVAAVWRKPPEDDRFTCVTGSGFRIFLLGCQDTKGIGVVDG